MLTLVEPPAVMPVTLAEAKEHLAVIGNADDALLTRLINAAVAAFDGPDGKLGRCLISQRWRLELNELAGNIRLPIGPVSAISEISYTDRAGNVVVLPLSDYSVSGLGSLWPAEIRARRWPTATAAAIEFTAGFGDAPQDVPADICAAILATAGAHYAWREAEIMAQGSIRENPEIADVVDRWRLRGFG